MTLESFFKNHPKCALAFSGGCDSSYLLWAAMQYGCQIQPYFIRTAFQPAFELEDAERLCRELGVKLKVLPLDALARPDVVKNDENRCYFCKTGLFSRLKEQALSDGYGILLDGTNASDNASDRPGMRALQELSVRSPLRECGITKEQVRAFSKQAGLFTHDKPAYACLATRIQTGRAITAEDLKRVEKAESILFKMGFSDLRVRLFHDCARIQLPEKQFCEAVKRHKEIVAGLQEDFKGVFLDLVQRGES